MDTLAEVDALIAQASDIPPDERTGVWHVIMNSLLDRRLALAPQDDGSTSLDR